MIAQPRIAARADASIRGTQETAACVLTAPAPNQNHRWPGSFAGQRISTKRLTTLSTLPPSTDHCADCVKLLGEYVDGSLAKDQAEALERHLSLCMPCITFLRTYKATGRLCRHKLAKDMPGELKKGLASFLMSKVPGFKPPQQPQVSPAVAGEAHAQVQEAQGAAQDKKV